jgi:hypothetical protein
MERHPILALPDSPENNTSDYIDEEDFIAVVVPDSLAGERLDKVLAQLIPQHSRNRLTNLDRGWFCHDRWRNTQNSVFSQSGRSNHGDPAGQR